jgi:hypothetical protein
MSNIIKIKQKDIENIVNTILEDMTEQNDIETDVVDEPNLKDNSDIQKDPTDLMNPTVMNMMKKYNLEIRPGTDEKSRNGSKIGLGKDSSGNVYVVDYSTNKILGIKKA